MSAKPIVSVKELFDEISNAVLNGDADLNMVRAECATLSDLVTVIGETRETSKIKQLEGTISDLMKMKQNLGQDTTSKPIEDAIQKYNAELGALKKQLVMDKKVVPQPVAPAWKQQVGKKQIEEGKTKFKTFWYGLGKGSIQFRCLLVEDDVTAPHGWICMRKNGTIFIYINGELREIPKCTFHIEGDSETDDFTHKGTKFFDADRNDGNQNASDYADIRNPEGGANSARHHVNFVSVNRVIKTPRMMSQNSARAASDGFMSNAILFLFSADNIRVDPNHTRQTGKGKK